MERILHPLPCAGAPPLEAYRFQDLRQPFPDHFHDYYVIGLVERGGRCLTWRGRNYLLRPGDLLLFNPGDTHGCTPWGTEVFAYRGLNIPTAAMAILSGRRTPLEFSQPVLSGLPLQGALQAFHQQAISDSGTVQTLPPLLSALLAQYGRVPTVPRGHDPVETACQFMEAHYNQRITLAQLCQCTALSKSTLRRAFLRTKGVTPYRYLQALRINRAKALLEQGASPVEAALESGFADQSHCSTFFQRYLGLSPAAYRRSLHPAPEDPHHEP